MFSRFFIGKHDTSSSSTHFLDLDNLYSEPAFREVLLTGEGTAKPVLWLRADGASDENPKNEKVCEICNTWFLPCWKALHSVTG